MSGARGLGYAAGQYFSLGLEREAASAPLPGHLAFAGVIIEHENRILLEETPRGFRVPQLPLGDRVRVRAALDNWLRGAGLKLTVGQAYSVFDESATEVRYTYFLAQAETSATGGLGHYVPIKSLGERQFVSDAHAQMLQRFALEHETQSFGLYIGEEVDAPADDLLNQG